MFKIPAINRRDFLQSLGCSFGSLALVGIGGLPADSVAANDLRARKIDPLQPFAPRPPDFAPLAKSVIFLFMVGGPNALAGTCTSVRDEVGRGSDR